MTILRKIPANLNPCANSASPPEYALTMSTLPQPPVGAKIVQMLGVVHATEIRRDIGGDVSAFASRESLPGLYQQNCEKTRQTVMHRLQEKAIQLGANAVLGIQFGNSALPGKKQFNETFCYGTAVILANEL